MLLLNYSSQIYHFKYFLHLCNFLFILHGLMILNRFFFRKYFIFYYNYITYVDLKVMIFTFVIFRFLKYLNNLEKKVNVYYSIKLTNKIFFLYQKL